MGLGEAAPTSAVAGYCSSGDTVVHPAAGSVSLSAIRVGAATRHKPLPPPIVFEANVRGAAVIRSMEGTIWRSVWVLLALWG